jgi:hypothetical protein
MVTVAMAYTSVREANSALTKFQGVEGKERNGYGVAVYQSVSIAYGPKLHPGISAPQCRDVAIRRS